MCGKDILCTMAVSFQLGSPPHVRERLILAILGLLYTRITPACAGKTTLAGLPSSSIRDHPRMCGKDRRLRSEILPERGSPPHVRERRKTYKWNGSAYGITPACAGKTS